MTRWPCLLAVLLLASGAFTIQACGGSRQTLGNLCGQPECAYDALVCQFYPTPNDAYKVQFIDRHDNRYRDRYLATLVIDLIGLAETDRFRLEGAEFDARVMLQGQEIEEQLGSISWQSLDVVDDGRREGRPLRGEIVGPTLGGSRIGAGFECTLESPF